MTASGAAETECWPVAELHRAADRQRYGAKAATLARLTAAGMRVPAGLVVPAGLPDDHLHDAATRICSWAAGRAPFGLVARSSAATEDGRLASFAGLYSSRFTPTVPDALLHALVQVRSSSASAPALSYATDRGVQVDASGMAVLVQPAIRAYVSGVLAAHIVGGQPKRWHIAATHGLAESLLAGAQTGGSYIGDEHGPQSTQLGRNPLISLPASPEELDMPPGEWITLTTPTGQANPAKLASSNGALVHVRRPTDWDSQPALTPADCERILQTAANAAAILAIDTIDIEWVLDTAGTLWLVQARPLTAAIPDNQPDPEPTGSRKHGIPASPGIGTGHAVHLREGSTTTEAAGNVIICGPLDPDAVPALLARPAAVVSTTGGPLSHTAIIARELGIPCVTAVEDAFTTIAPGALIQVDGTTGTITTVSQPPTHPTTAQDLRDTAVLAWADASAQLNDPDGRAGTLLLHNLGDAFDQTLIRLAGAQPTQAPVGVLQPATYPEFPAIPVGYEELVTDLGRLLWPTERAHPARIAILDIDGDLVYARQLEYPSAT